MSHAAIMECSPEGVIGRAQRFATEAEADAHVALYSVPDPNNENRLVFPDAFVVPDPGGDFRDWVGDPVAKTVSYTPPAITRDMVEEELVRRIEQGFTFNGKHYQYDDRSQKRIRAAESSAQTAVIGGAQAGNYQWHGLPVDFAWTATDNTDTLMDAQTVLLFGAAASANEGLLFLKARTLKNMDPIPQDYATNESYW